MKTHLAKETKRAQGFIMTGFACDNNPFKKGLAVPFERFIKAENQCKKCLDSYEYQKHYRDEHDIRK